jgi:hypothetical protein
VNLLADESMERQIVEHLRLDGHLVLYVAEMEPSIGDDIDLQRANEHMALLVTEDKFFGEFVAIQPLEPGHDDLLVSELLASNPAFQALVARSKASPRKPFTGGSGS